MAVMLSGRCLHFRCQQLGLDIWSEVKGSDDNVSRADVAVPAASQRELAEWLSGLGVSWTVMVEDVKTLIDTQMADLAASKQADETERGFLNTSR
jgi:hypothetical protein